MDEMAKGKRKIDGSWDEQPEGKSRRLDSAQNYMEMKCYLQCDLVLCVYLIRRAGMLPKEFGEISCS